VPLGQELEEIAVAAGAYGPVSAVLAAELDASSRLYLVAFGEEEALEWLVVDAAARPLDGRAEIRDVASIVVLCELASELAGGGNLEELRERLAQVRMLERPEGIEEAEEAALALEHAVGAPPRVASPAYLDTVGAATQELEHALGEHDSPFASALAASQGAVDAFVLDVETRYKLALR
jgi:hypothetical protein